MEARVESETAPGPMKEAYVAWTRATRVPLCAEMSWGWGDHEARGLGALRSKLWDAWSTPPMYAAACPLMDCVPWVGTMSALSAAGATRSDARVRRGCMGGPPSLSR